MHATYLIYVGIWRERCQLKIYMYVVVSLCTFLKGV